MLLVEVYDPLNFIITPKEDAAAIVDILRNHLDHPAHVAVHCLAASCFQHQQSHKRLLSTDKGVLTVLEYHSHRSALVHDSQLALRTLAIRWIREDASVQ